MSIRSRPYKKCLWVDKQYDIIQLKLAGRPSYIQIIVPASTYVSHVKEFRVVISSQIYAKFWVILVFSLKKIVQRTPVSGGCSLANLGYSPAYQNISRRGQKAKKMIFGGSTCALYNFFTHDT